MTNSKAYATLVTVHNFNIIIQNFFFNIFIPNIIIYEYLFQCIIILRNSVKNKLNLNLTNHTKRPIPFSQFLRLRRLCSEDEDFHTKSLEMRDFFVQRGYPTSLLDTAFSKASQIPRSETLTDPVTNVTENSQIPLVLTFHPFMVTYTRNRHHLVVLSLRSSPV